MFRRTRIALIVTLAAILAAPAAVAHAGSAFAGRPGAVSDFSGDGFADVLGIDAAGRLLYYPNNGLRLTGPSQIGDGWSRFRHVKAGDWSGDGFADVLGIDTDGYLFYYPHNGNRLDGPIPFGHFSRATRHLAVADWSGDGHADLLVADATNGDLYYFPNQNNQAPTGTGQRIGAGFASLQHMVAADWSGDGFADVIGSDSSGNLWYYPHQGSGLGARQQIGSGGWQNFRFIRAMDFSGDGFADVLGVDSGGSLWYYPHQGSGLGARQSLGSGWGGFLNIL
ncbi:FG-GAP repeat domain-containing protein [Nonomuraea sp. PA05]|uniref:FG-GAP repeat domain-containing protein n=1 Tax=Nonomuraea sp. PA05 TaxID=2604466 RepID=UPI0016524E81|nr:VCBS repeat-containing protein [Nonomuraea sp. PA05]